MRLDVLRRANEARAKEWKLGSELEGDGDAKKALRLLFRSNELAGECGETANVVKKMARRLLDIRGKTASVDHLRDELGDMMVCIDLLAMEAGIDLSDATAEKFNKTSQENGLKTMIVYLEAGEYAMSRTPALKYEGKHCASCAELVHNRADAHQCLVEYGMVPFDQVTIDDDMAF